MLTFELVSKKRKPIKRNAFAGIICGFLILVLIAVAGKWINNSVKIAMMIVVAITFIICLYIINYSVKFKNPIGKISFFENYIETVINGKKEIVYIDNISSIRFKLSGYEALNNSTFFEFMFWKPAIFSYHNGMNNFVYVVTANGVKHFEFYIPDKKSMLAAKKMAQEYFHEAKK
jgi:hypothetical protein